MRFALANSPSRSLRAERSDPWVLATSVAAVAFGIVAAVALLQYHFIHFETRSPTGFVQGLVVGVHDAIGFMPSLYLSLLIVVWGGIGFVSGRMRDPARRMASALLFAICLSFLLGVFGSGGGDIGTRAASRLIAVAGTVPIVLFLGLMTIAAAALATDWFFLRNVLRERPVTIPADIGLDPDEESLLREAAEPTGETLVEARQRRLGLVPRPASGVARGAEAEERQREQELLDRVLQEARRDLDRKPLEPTPVAIDVEPGRVDDGADEIELVDGLAELDDDEALIKAGDQLDLALSDDGEPLVIVPGPDAESEQLPDEVADDATEEATEEAVDDVILDPLPRVERYTPPAETAALTQEQMFAEVEVDDELLDRAVRVLLTARRPTPSLLQRKLGLGYGEAREVLDRLAELGVVARPDESGHWEALIELDEWGA